MLKKLQDVPMRQRLVLRAGRWSAENQYFTKWLTMAAPPDIFNHMVNNQAGELDLIFYALADPTRRRILSMVGEKTRTVTELAHPFRMTLAAVSKHIKVLEKAKLLKRTRQGRVHHCTLDAAPLVKAEECIRFYQQFWNERLDELAHYLERETDVSKKRK